MTVLQVRWYSSWFPGGIEMLIFFYCLNHPNHSKPEWLSRQRTKLTLVCSLLRATLHFNDQILFESLNLVLSLTIVRRKKVTSFGFLPHTMSWVTYDIVGRSLRHRRPHQRYLMSHRTYYIVCMIFKGKTYDIVGYYSIVL